MHKFLHAVIVVIFLLYTSLVSAATMHSCCSDRDCPVTQCADMGCASAQQPQLPAPLLPAAPPD